MLGLARNPALERLAADGTSKADRQFKTSSPPQRSFGSFAYAATWDRPRRVILKAEPTAQGPNPPFIVVHVPGDPRELSEDISCPRGDMENRIKEPQWGLFADRTSGHRFGANQFRLLKLLKVAARVVIAARRRVFHRARSDPSGEWLRAVLEPVRSPAIPGGRQWGNPERGDGARRPWPCGGQGGSLPAASAECRPGGIR